MNRTQKIWTTIYLSTMLYIAVSCIVYRFRHPYQTETELFTNIGHALTWDRLSE